MHAFLRKVVLDNLKACPRFARHSSKYGMQPGFQVLYCICKLKINGIAHYYVSGEETSINLNILVKRSVAVRGSYGMVLHEGVTTASFKIATRMYRISIEQCNLTGPMEFVLTRAHCNTII